jgi:hypothetical protein
MRRDKGKKEVMALAFRRLDETLERAYFPRVGKDRGGVRKRANVESIGSFVCAAYLNKPLDNCSLNELSFGVDPKTQNSCETNV